MTSFGWKRKIGEKISRTASAAFQADTEEDEDEIDDGQVDWLTLAPKRTIGESSLILEDTVCKSDRLRQEGNALCEAERYWEAIQKWDEAIQLTPCNEILFELKAQVLLILQEVFPAVQFAEKATKLRPNWWSAYQTLGRALLGLGEVKLAVRAFSKAVHLNPTVKELWKEDLQWACTLLEQKKHISAELVDPALTNSATIKELDTESRTNDVEEYAEDVSGQDKADSDDENEDALAVEKYSNYRQQRMGSYQNPSPPLAPMTETVKPHEELSPPHEESSPPHEELSPPHEELSPPHEEMSPPHEEMSPPHEEMSPQHEELSPPHEELSPSHESSQTKKTVKSMPTDYVMMR